jgi:ABC-type antimicrobial peptide transport system permease subunit
MRKIFRIFRTAFRALGRNITRAVLTTLGIIIGVGAVIAMMEIGRGSSASIQRTIASMGANNFSVQPGQAASGGVSFGAGSVMTLTPQDAESIDRECTAIRAVAPVERTRAQVVYGNKNWVPFFIYGTTPDYLVARDWTTLAEGEMFTDRDVRNASKVCVLGQTLVKQLFGSEDPIDKEIRVKNVTFRVMGVLQAKGANMMGFDQDDMLLAPWTTIKYRVSGSSAQISNASAASGSGGGAGAVTVNSLSNLYPTNNTTLYPVPSAIQQADTPTPVHFTNVDEIQVSASSADTVQLAIKQVTDVLRERHRLRPEEPEDFSIRSMTEMTKALASTTMMMTNLLLCVALISLVVGGVGIMNIMLVSVTERTREIGLRMAVGARARNILMQFLVEAIVLCLAGGIVGILLGVGSSWLVTYFLGWPTESSPEAIVAAVAVSASVGIIFGYYPAWKASRLDPIEALRYE